MPKNIYYPVDQIRKHIEDGKTQDWIARHLVESGFDPKITSKSIYKVCRKHQIKCQRTGPREGKGHPEWKGGIIKSRSGYIEVYCPDHPYLVNKNKISESKSNGKYFRKKKYMLEHRLVMEKKIGRYLLPTEVVHHIDGDTTNNHPDNLELFENNAEHLKATLLGKIPNWTKDGVSRIRAGNSKENRRFLAILKNAIRRESKGDAPLSRSEVARYLKQLGKSAKEVCEMASLHELPPFDDRSKH
jgi:hypothetical protein